MYRTVVAQDALRDRIMRRTNLRQRQAARRERLLKDSMEL
jgi:hypothetical protein